MSKKFERHETRLATTDEKGNRVYLYPEDVKGKWRSFRMPFFWFLISLYLVLPWLRWNGQQLVQLNIATREFHLFGSIFYAHDAPLLIFLFLLVGILIFYLTSLYGRVWCGHACPQTVFIDAIFLKIEKWVEGNARKREQLAKAPWSREKIIKKVVKWSLFTLASLHIAHSFMGYFVGTKELFWITLSPPWENPLLFFLTMGLSALILFDFGWFREQFCIIVCPYGRLQSVLMDENSLVVGYDYKRGEPRRAPEIPAEKEGDCINCYLCVKVCPTGIDIRRGTQLECIACTKCIDACDSIMEKVQKPKGLIRYTSEKELSGEKRKSVTTRSLIYMSLLSIVGLGLIFTLYNKSEMDIVLISAGRDPFMVQGEMISNQKRWSISYTHHESRKVLVESPHPKIQVVLPQNPIQIEKGRQTGPLFVRFKKEDYPLLPSKVEIHFIDHEKNMLLKSLEVPLVGPKL